MVEKKGFDWFFDKTFGGHVDLAKIPEAEKQQYIADWSQPGAFNAMLNWYRAARLIVPPPGATVPLPDWLLRAFPRCSVPTLVVWGMKDSGAAADPAGRPRPAGRRSHHRPTAGGRSFRAVGSTGRSGRARSSPSLPPSARLLPRRHESDPLPFTIRCPPRRRPGALPAGDGGHADPAAAQGIPRPPARRDDRGRALSRRRTRLLRRYRDRRRARAARRSTR